MDQPSEVYGSPAGQNPVFAAPGDSKPIGGGRNPFSFFGLRRNPFNINPDPRDLFWTPQTLRALSELTSAVESRKSLIVLTGEVGTGKTTLIHHLLRSLRQRSLPVAFVFNSHLDIDNLYDFILADFGIREDPARPRNLRKTLHDWLYARHRSRQRPILIVDEAQGLSFAVLEELRMLLNLQMDGENLIQLILSGQPELDATLAKPHLLQLRQRISLRCRTAPLTIAETHDYVHRRLQLAGAQPEGVFAHETLDAIYFYSGGTPRVVNLLCEQSLLRARDRNILPISAEIVEEVAREFQFDDFKPFPRSLDLSPTSIAEVLPMPSSPTKMRMAAMAARELGARAETRDAPAVIALAPPALPAPPATAANPRYPAPPPAGLLRAREQTSFAPQPPPPAIPRPLPSTIGAALAPALHAVRHLLAASSRWLRQPMRPAHSRHT